MFYSVPTPVLFDDEAASPGISIALTVLGNAAIISMVSVALANAHMDVVTKTCNVAPNVDSTLSLARVTAHSYCMHMIMPCFIHSLQEQSRNFLIVPHIVKKFNYMKCFKNLGQLLDHATRNLAHHLWYTAQESLHFTLH